ncbi:TetR/AcrR family transcriptional regulator [Micromonospora endolithica]|uniref:TetR family transcriptional regulator n=1 Tax=Micromonospora endolithica TaxID=230091 RepID=A0A3A9YZF3_9ACTN|nr:TetR family transcriptional regulator C-terminal domain-containing protein [Micromonospora endolithica]RKN41413.1 TetR family transcriptional regulator [Micromonospora endolithica]TWJ21834.1 TetR family transcriptional regulator [Micromonospora endolithica]
MDDRQRQILDAAITVLGTRGPRHLTHRAVDDQAGLPTGSTSNRYRTREALLAGVLDRVLDAEAATWNRLATDLHHPIHPDTFATVVGALVHHLAHDGRVLTLARLAIFGEAAHQPALQRRIAHGQATLATWATPVLASLGAHHPTRALRLLLALIDGLLNNQLANPDPAFDPTTAIGTVLPAILTGHET